MKDEYIKKAKVLKVVDGDTFDLDIADIYLKNGLLVADILRGKGFLK